MTLDWDRDGSCRFGKVLNERELQALEHALAELDRGRAGQRIADLTRLRPWLAKGGVVWTIAANVQGDSTRAVRAILFDKSPSANWSLGWHQDRTIAVVEQHAVAGFENWTVKQGIPHVEPPFGLIERMVTVRLHLDDVDADNAPLKIIPGSGALGRVAERDIGTIVRRRGSFPCLAGAGDAWLYRTAILHASDASSSSRRRRVLQVDYSADELPAPLRWHADINPINLLR